MKKLLLVYNKSVKSLFFLCFNENVNIHALKIIYARLNNKIHSALRFIYSVRKHVYVINILGYHKKKNKEKKSFHKIILSWKITKKNLSSILTN